jgi:hypothetical protein
MTGRASDEKKKIELLIKPFVVKEKGFLLTIKFSGDGRDNTTGAGVWPTIEKAKQVEEETASKLLHGAVVVGIKQWALAH